MSVRRLAEAELQPQGFEPSAETMAFANAVVKKYPEGKQASAVIPLLWKVQEQDEHQWVSEPAIRWTAEFLDMPYIRVYEVATFYTMFNLSPVGRYHVQLCGTTPCMLCGSEDLKEVCRDMIGEQMHVTEDGTFSWIEVECLGACCNAPMAQINKDYYEDLTPENFRALLEDLKAGKDVKPGPQNGRHTSEPLGGLTSLFDGSAGTKKKTASKAPAKKAAPSKAKPDEADLSEGRPQGLDAARDGKADNLKMISGVGPKIEGILNGLGIFHFDQITEWSKTERDWIDSYLKFKGRIERDEWVKQAKVLAEGGAEAYERVFGKKP